MSNFLVGLSIFCLDCGEIEVPVSIFFVGVVCWAVWSRRFLGKCSWSSAQDWSGIFRSCCLNFGDWSGRGGSWRFLCGSSDIAWTGLLWSKFLRDAISTVEWCGVIGRGTGTGMGAGFFCSKKGFILFYL